MDQSIADSLADEARLADVSFYLGDPYPTYARLRREAPVYWCEPGKFWALTKHEDILWTELQPNPPFTTIQGLSIPEAARPDHIGERDPGGAQQGGGGFMSDPPDHTKFRQLVSRAFTPKRMADLEPSVYSIVGELLDSLPDGEPVDFVEAVSVPLALRVIGEFLGTSKQDLDDMRRWADSFMSYIGGGLAEGSPEAQKALEDMGQMFGFFGQNLAERAKNPRDDLMSSVVSMEQDGEPLSPESQVAICLSVLTAGNETTRNTLSGAMVTFPEYPGQWELLAADPSLAKSATEELLRYVSPVIHFGRRATQSLVIRDQQIAAGDFVVMLYGSGNRDEDVWENPDTFDITRGDSKHLSFGWGLHRCIGAALGRSEMRIALEGLTERFAGWEIAGEVTRNPTTMVNDYKSVPVILRRK